MAWSSACSVYSWNGSLGLWIFHSFSGTGSTFHICLFSFTDSCLFAMWSFLCWVSKLSYFCIFPSRLRTRQQHFPQGSQLQKKQIPMRKMSFRLLKRYVAHLAPGVSVWIVWWEISIPSLAFHNGQLPPTVCWPIPFLASIYHFSWSSP